MRTAYIIIDIGTGNMRAGLYEPDGTCLAIHTMDIEYIQDEAYEDACTFDPQKMFRNVLECIRLCLEQNDGIDVIGITAISQRQGIVLIDANGEPFLGLPNIDNRGKEFEREIDHEDFLYQQTGRWSKMYFSAYKLYGLKQKKEEQYKRINRISSISDWLGYMFTGKLCYEPSQACETLLFEPRYFKFSDELCEIFNISKQLLPEVKVCGEVLDTIKGETARLLGISESAVFIIGGADTQLALLGMGAKAGDVVIASGTTTPITYLSDHYFVDPKKRCWTNNFVTPDLFVVETNVGVTGLNYQRFKNVFYPYLSYEEIDDQIDIAKAPRCLCSLATMEFSNRKVLPLGGFVLNTPVSKDLSCCDFAFAMLVDMACGIRENIEAMETITGREFRSVIGCGGGFSGDVFTQLVADFIGKKVILKQGFRQASTLGGIKVMNSFFGDAQLKNDLYKSYEPIRRDWHMRTYQDWKIMKAKLNG